MTGAMKRLTEVGDVSDAALSPDGKLAAYVRSEGAGESLWVRQVQASGTFCIRPAARVQYSGLTFSLDSSWVYFVLDNLREFRSLYRVAAFGGEPTKVLDDIDSPVAISPSGKKLAFVRNDPDRNECYLIVSNTEDGQEHKIAKLKFPPRLSSTGSVWSPDEASILSAIRHPGPHPSGAMNIARIGMSGALADVLEHPFTWIGRVSPLANGALTFVAAESGFLAAQIWELPRGARKAIPLTRGVTDYGTVTTSAEGRTLLTVQRDQASSLWIANPYSSEMPHRITPVSGHYYSVSWLNSGELITNHGDSGESQLSRLGADGTRLRTLSQMSAVNWQPRVSPDGKFISYTSNRTGTWQVWIAESDGSHPRQLTRSSGINSYPQWGPNSEFVYFTNHDDSGSRIMRMRKDGSGAAVVGSLPCRKQAVSSDGRRVAAECQIEQNGPWRVVWFDANGQNMHVMPQIPVSALLGPAPASWVPGEQTLELYRYPEWRVEYHGFFRENRQNETLDAFHR